MCLKACGVNGLKKMEPRIMAKRDRWKAVLLRSKNNAGIITPVFWSNHLSCLKGKIRRWVGEDVG